MKTIGTWNYRVATKVVDGKRNFGIIECYYDNDNNIVDYSDDIKPLSNFTEIEMLVSNYYVIENCFQLPIIDLDNFPKYFRIIEMKDEK